MQMYPEHGLAWKILGVALVQQGRAAEALIPMTTAIRYAPHDADAHNNLGAILSDLGQFEEAEVSYGRAVAIRADYAEAYYNRGIVLKELDRIQEAESSYRQALSLKPTMVEARHNLGRLLLFQGKYSAAWPYYESRYHPDIKGKSTIIPHLGFPQWQGESLAGKSLLIWPEQGYGDYIQFVLYVTLLKARGLSYLTLACPSPLIPLFETLESVDAVISTAARIPHHDYWSFPLSLPLHFATTLESIPNTIPYLSTSPERMEHWYPHLPKETYNVGLVWRGNPAHSNDRNRSLPTIDLLAPLWSVPGVTFISLQKGPEAEAMKGSTSHLPMLLFGQDINDFADTAAIVAQLDLVICVDSAIAHLAGALAKPCWVLLPARNTDWRWLKERSDSPWYPGVMRLFRQTECKDWTGVISHVASALKQLPKGKKMGSQHVHVHERRYSILKL